MDEFCLRINWSTQALTLLNSVIHNIYILHITYILYIFYRHNSDIKTNNSGAINWENAQYIV
jgi:hypothetical protein